MLYISRQLDPGVYGVVDTDDEVEEVVAVKEIENILSQHNLKIVGVQLVNGFVSKVEPYSYNPTVLQTKALAVLGVDIRTYKGEITMIKLCSNCQSCQVDLSKFGKSMSSYIGIDESEAPSGVLVTLGLSENLVCGLFDVAVRNSIRYDLRGVHDDAVADSFYELLIKREIRRFTWVKYVLDISRRKEYWLCVYALDCSVDSATSIISSCRRLKEISPRLEALHIADFRDVAETDIYKALFFNINAEELAGLVRGCFDGGYLVLSQSDDYEELRQFCIGMFDILHCASIIETLKVIRFRNFVHFFDASDEMKGLYVQLCHAVGDAITRRMRS